MRKKEKGVWKRWRQAEQTMQPNRVPCADKKKKKRTGDENRNNQRLSLSNLLTKKKKAIRDKKKNGPKETPIENGTILNTHTTGKGESNRCRTMKSNKRKSKDALYEDSKRKNFAKWREQKMKKIIVHLFRREEWRKCSTTLFSSDILWKNDPIKNMNLNN